MPYAVPIASFAYIEEEFIERVHSIVWYSVAAIDTHDRPHSRILHPIWERAALRHPPPRPQDPGESRVWRA